MEIDIRRITLIVHGACGSFYRIARFCADAPRPTIRYECVWVASPRDSSQVYIHYREVFVVVLFKHANRVVKLLRRSIASKMFIYSPSSIYKSRENKSP